jgi:hypothetical protein
MAGFNPLTQRAARNSTEEFGTIDFTADELTVEVPTRLNTVISGLGTITDDLLVAVTDKVITSGAVTFTRAAGGTSAAELQYRLSGY